MPEFDPLTILSELQRAGVRYVVVGGLAARIAGAPIVTGDVDIVPEKSEENIDLLVAALTALGATFRIGELTTEAPVSANTLLQNDSIQASTQAGDLDILFVPAGTFGYSDLVRAATREEVGDGLVVDVAALADVIRSKEAAGRLKDQGQLPLLRATLEQLRALD